MNSLVRQFENGSRVANTETQRILLKHSQGGPLCFRQFLLLFFSPTPPVQID